MEQLADLAPVVQILDDPVPLMVRQLVEVFRFFDVFVPKQVIAVPKIPQDRISKRFVDLRRPQKAEQVVEVPTVLSPSSLRQQRAEQFVDIPVPRGRREGGGSLQGSRPGQFSAASSSLLRSADEVFTRVFRTLPRPKKSARLGPHSGSELSADFTPSTPAAHVDTDSDDDDGPPVWWAEKGEAWWQSSTDRTVYWDAPG